jgi:hypothetical protein
MTIYQQIHKNYRALASDRSAVNWLNNGAFTSFSRKMAVIKNLSEDRINTTIGRAAHDLVDPALYMRSFYSFAVPTTAGNQFLGYWEVSGISGSLTINPSDRSGNVMTSYDGGNLLVVSGSATGSIILDQKIEYYQPLAGQEVTIAISGKKLTGPVKAEFILVDSEEMHALDISSQFFGDYRRFHKTFKLKDDLTSLTFRVRLTGNGSWSIGLSGLSLTLGANSLVSYTHSIADLTIPKGTVFMFTGDSCPSGYVVVADQRMAVVRGASNYHIENGEHVQEFGQDEHDHVELDGQVDALFTPSDLRTPTAEEMPRDASRWLHSVPYRDASVWSNGGADTFPDEDAAAVLGVEHGHTLVTKMSSLPPTFKVRFCEKL